MGKPLGKSTIAKYAVGKCAVDWYPFWLSSRLGLHCCSTGLGFAWSWQGHLFVYLFVRAACLVRQNLCIERKFFHSS